MRLAASGSLVTRTGALALILAISAGCTLSGVSKTSLIGSPSLEKSSLSLGQAYPVTGSRYASGEASGAVEVGTASWYGSKFQGNSTAIGEIYDKEGLTAAHPTLDLPSVARVTNVENGRSVVVRVNDRGPYVGDRVIDLSERAANELGFAHRGVATVEIKVLSDETRMVAALSDGTPLDALAAPTTGVAGGEPVPTIAVSSEGLYFVEAGAFMVEANAERARDSLNGLSARTGVVPAVVQGTWVYRLRLGPVSSQEEARRLKEAFTDAGHTDAAVIGK